MVTHHLLDSLAVLPYLPGASACDSSMLEAVADCPASRWRSSGPTGSVTLLDSNHKKAAFLRQAVIELNLANVEVIAGRAEDVVPDCSISILRSRALFPTSRLFVNVAARVALRAGQVHCDEGRLPA